MLQYLIIQLCDTSTSYCHYCNEHTERKLMPLDVLEKAVLWAMKEHVMLQVVRPAYALPQKYEEVLDRMEHTDIVPATSPLVEKAEIVVLNQWNELHEFHFLKDTSYVMRTNRMNLFENYRDLAPILPKVERLNIVITDVAEFKDNDFETYQEVLRYLADEVEKIFVNGGQVQLNLLTDRMLLDKMNSCGAGDTHVTLAPDGKFYVCPAFYNAPNGMSVGNIDGGLDIKNAQLYRLDHAPICRHCDAYQCKRCVWLNRKTTYEVNVPGHEQCVVAHLERNASAALLKSIRKHGDFLPNIEEIKVLECLDPFEKHKEWK